MDVTMKLQSIWQVLVGSERPEPRAGEARPASQPPSTAGRAIEIAPNDPIIPFLESSPGVVEVDKLNLDSPGVRQLKAAGVKLAVPLISQGELVGMLNMGHRLSEQEYSTDDLRLLRRLSRQAAPAVRVAQLARQQQVEVRERERLEQELRVASVIQQTLLPQSLPDLPGWQMNAHYQPAREVGGDFYDFLDLPDGRLGLVVGDVTDKGVPAALVMATTRAILRAAAEQLISPGAMLRRANDVLYPDILAKMFVTCLYAVLDPKEGLLRFANAGQDLPCVRNADGLRELRATGMPLGLMPGMEYEEKEVLLKPGKSVFMYSDGLVEAHNEQREMFGLPRLRDLVREHPGGATLIDFLLNELADFTGPGSIQEDDVTMVTLLRLDSTDAVEHVSHTSAATVEEPEEPGWRTLLEFELPSEPGNERQAMERVAEAVQGLGLSPVRLERLNTAVAEATMNAMEHGNEYKADLPVSLRVAASTAAVSVRITDHGGLEDVSEPEIPDLEAKLAGLQSPRGWGLFLIKEMVDEFNVTSDEEHDTIELVVNLRGDEDDG
jgi:serine phosphatase RsbU (regulator of sigma subunit)/anti-sigma regulatory factor (Ser/Thr protein kinase)